MTNIGRFNLFNRKPWMTWSHRSVPMFQSDLIYQNRKSTIFCLQSMGWENKLTIWSDQGHLGGGVKGGGVMVNHFFSMSSPFCREPPTESACPHPMSKFQVPLETSRVSPPKMTIFGPRKRIKLREIWLFLTNSNPNDFKLGMLTPAGSIQTKIMLLENFCEKNVPFWGISLFFF